MNELGLSAREVAERVGGTYEHIRKLRLGYCLPSDFLLKKLCNVLELDGREMRTRVEKDRMIFRFGDAAWEAAGINPRAGPIYILFPLLSPSEREYFTTVLRALADSHRQKAGKNDGGTDL